MLYRLGKVMLLVAGIYFLLNFSSFLSGNFSAPSSHEPLSFALLFIAGTFTGFHCAGMCGSLVIGYTVRAANKGGAKYLTHLYYGVGKTLSYTVIGGIFGALGSVVTFTPFMRGVAGLLAGVFLLLFGLSSLRLLPVSRDLQFRAPPFLMKHLGGLLRRASSPFVIGLLNGLMIICGPLQAMYILAAGTGSPVEGAKMLFFLRFRHTPPHDGFRISCQRFVGADGSKAGSDFRRHRYCVGRHHVAAGLSHAVQGRRRPCGHGALLAVEQRFILSGHDSQSD